jgi:hypothetical protein
LRKNYRAISGKYLFAKLIPVIYFPASILDHLTTFAEKMLDDPGLIYR